MREYNRHKLLRRTKTRIQRPLSFDAYPDQQDRFHCSRVKLPICMHPLVTARGEETTRFMLLQACYRFMEEIADTEDNIVIDINRKILDRSYMAHLDDSCHQVIRSINVDEYMHGVASSNYLDRLKARTRCEPIQFKAPSTRDEMIRQSRQIEDAEVRELFEISVLCLIENAVSNSLLDYTKDERCHDAFKAFNGRLLKIEAFHGQFYRELLMTAYRRAGIDVQESVARIVPAFIRTSLHAYEGRRDYAHILLEHCGFSDKQAETVVSETYPETSDACRFSTLNVAAARSLELLAQIPVYQRSDIKKCFKLYGLVL